MEVSGVKRFILASTCLALMAIELTALPALAAPASYTITDIGVAGLDSYAWGLNGTPVVVGQARTSTNNFNQEAYTWTSGTLTSLGSLNNSGSSIAHAVNAAGLIVGGSATGTGGSHAVSWNGTTATDLGTFAGNSSEAFGINGGGQIVGEGCVTVTCFTHALLWDGAGPVDLGTLPGGDASHARGINDAGQIIGDSEISSGGDSHAVIWEAGGITDLGTLPGDSYSNGVAINAAGHATGRSGGRPGGGQYAFFWDGSMHELPMLPGGTFLEAAAINGSDQIVGRGDLLQGQTAFLWESATGHTIDLNALLPSGSGWQLSTATGINDAGQIVGYGYYFGALHGFLMTPSSNPAPTDIARAVVPAGGTVSTSTGATTPGDPISTTVTSPQAGLISIREGVSDVALPSGFAILGSQIRISAPSATPSDPLRLTFEFNASIIPAGQDASTIQVFRDSTAAPACLGSVAADPDPCVVDRQALAGGSARITVLSSHASAWTGAVSTAPPAFPFTGFFSPLSNEPALNKVNAGSSLPVKFGLGGDRGLGVLAAGFPKVQPIDCSSLAPSGTPVPATGKLTYATDKYTYTWTTPKSLANTCQQLVVKLSDTTQHR
ncbi:MAG: hypothetical protein QOI81_1246, partial [Actinomycetota bacterium]|nr:hypothetical protein [Actinomycetota bacterium]